MEIPSVTAVNGTSYEKLANNTLYSYPLKLDGHLCWPYDLSVCTVDPNLDNVCCKQLHDKDSWPEQTFEIGDIVIGVLIYFFYTSFRVLMWRNIANTYSYITICPQYWVLVFMDESVSCFIGAVYGSLLSTFVKRIVGAPRPIHYALKLYASIHADVRKSLKGLFCA